MLPCPTSPSSASRRRCCRSRAPSARSSRCRPTCRSLEQRRQNSGVARQAEPDLQTLFKSFPFSLATRLFTSWSNKNTELCRHAESSESTNHHNRHVAATLGLTAGNLQILPSFENKGGGGGSLSTSSFPKRDCDYIRSASKKYNRYRTASH